MGSGCSRGGSVWSLIFIKSNMGQSSSSSKLDQQPTQQHKGFKCYPEDVYGSGNLTSADLARSPLMAACMEGNISMILDILSDNDPSARTINGKVFMVAVKEMVKLDHFEIIKVMFSYGRPFVVFAACTIGTVDMMEKTLALVRETSGYVIKPTISLLAGACMAGNVAVVRELITPEKICMISSIPHMDCRQGPGINDRNRDGLTPLHFACRWSKYDVAKILIDAGADVNALCDKSQEPLSAVCQLALGDSCRLVELLVNHGADIDHVDKDGYTPFGMLCLFSLSYGNNNRIPVASMLLDNNANPYHKDEDGTPLVEWVLAGELNTFIKSHIDWRINMLLIVNAWMTDDHTPLRSPQIIHPIESNMLKHLSDLLYPDTCQ